MSTEDTSLSLKAASEPVLGQPLSIFILDSFALLAFLEGEESAKVIQGILENAQEGKCQVMMSLINLGEVAYITEREQGLSRAQAALAAVQQLPVQILPADQNAVFAAAHLKAYHRLSFADAFAAAAAQVFGGVLVTGDPEFTSVSGLISIQWLTR